MFYFESQTFKIGINQPMLVKYLEYVYMINNISVKFQLIIYFIRNNYYNIFYGMRFYYAIKVLFLVLKINIINRNLW